jgi:DNA-binding protein HU-beta
LVSVLIKSVYEQGVYMNKAEMIEFMSKDSKLTKSACKSALESFVSGIEVALKKKMNVVLTGFGTFSLVHRKERWGINPSTKKKMKIPAKKVPKFKPGKHFKDLF